MGDKKIPFWKNRYFWISLVAGWLGFLFNQFPLSYQLGGHTISVQLGLVFPLLIALTLGWKYALLCATLGFVGFSNWFLWPDNGWANVPTSIVYILWYTWQGVLAGKRKEKSVWYLNAYIGEGIYRIFFGLVLLLSYPILLPIPSPQWMAGPNPIPMDISVLFVILNKTTINSFVALLLADLLRRISPIRRLLKHRKKNAQKYEDRLVYISLGTGLLFYPLSGFMTYLLLNREGRSLGEVIFLNPYPQDTLARLLVLAIALVAGVILSSFMGRLEKSEKELWESREKFRQLTENTSDWIWELDTNAIFRYASPQVENLLGYTPEELIGTSAFAPIPAEADEAIRNSFDNSVRNGTPFKNLMNINRHKDGHLVFMESSGEPFFNGDGDLLGFRGIDRDITDRIKAEHEARLFKNIADSASYGIAISELDFTLIYVNPALAEMHGYRAEELIGQPISILHNQEQLKEVESYLEGLKDRGSFNAVEIMHMKKDRSVFPTLMSAHYFREESEQRKLLTATILDISDRKAMEKQMLETQKMESIGQLASGVAHDVNNMLTAIMGSAEILQEQLQDKNLSSEYTSLIMESTERAAKLTSDLLTFGRRDSPQLTALDLKAVINNALSILNKTLDRKISINLDWTAQENQILGNENQILSVVINLAINALHAMPKGGKLIFRAYNEPFKHELEKAEKIVLEVIDSGTGISKEHISRIFEPFYTTKELGKGTGLGLSVAYGIIHQHKGVIKVESTINVGTTFRIILPLRKTAGGAN